MTSANEHGNFDQQPPVPVVDYDKSIRYFCGAYEEIFRLAHCCLSATLAEQANLLVVGAGTGMEIATFAPLSPGWSYCGVDPSGDMLALARQRIDGLRLSCAIELFKGYVHDLNDAPAFDAATCILVMHFLPDDGAKLALLKSIRERLKPGAPLVLVDGYGEPGSPAFEQVKNAWMRYPLMQGVRAEIVETAFAEVILRMIRFVPEARIRELLYQAGFSQVFRFYTGFLYGGWTAIK